MRKGFEIVEAVVAVIILFLLATGIIIVCLKNCTKEVVSLDKNYKSAISAEESFAKSGKFSYSADDTLAGLAKRFGVDWCWLNPNCGAANMEVRLKFPVNFHVIKWNDCDIKGDEDVKNDGSYNDYTIKLTTGKGTGYASNIGGFRKVSLKEITEYCNKMPPFASINDGLLKQVIHVEWYE